MKLDEFYDWLEERDAFHPFLRNIKKQYPNKDLDKYIESLFSKNKGFIIVLAFNWDNTDEGADYWCNIGDDLYQNIKGEKITK